MRADFDDVKGGSSGGGGVGGGEGSGWTELAREQVKVTCDV